MFRLLILLGLLLGSFSALPGAAQARYAAIVVDADTGRILHAENAETELYPASLTKIMTIFMTFEAVREGSLKLDQRLPVSRVAAGRAPSKLGLKMGETISVEDAISALVTKSANDVATVLAEAIGGTERKFARLMTERARELGMKDTTFQNASGLPNRGQLSTATDMAVLARAVLARFPREYRYFSQRSFAWRGASHKNHNKLLDSYDGVDGIKTGYISASGFNLVASAKRNDVRIIAVMFGGKTSKARNDRVAALLDIGFTQTAKLAARPEKSIAARSSGSWLIPQANAAVMDRAPAPVAKAAPAIRTTSRPTTDRPANLNSWAIQVGAFNRYAPAHLAVTKAARAVPDLLGSKFAIVRQKSDSRKRPDIFKARLLVDTESKARQSCEQLKRRDVDCMVIWMGPSRSS